MSPSICVVARELDYLYKNGGIGTHNWLLSLTLAEAGWDTHILYHGPIEDRSGLEFVRAECGARGIKLTLVDELTSEDPQLRIPNIMGDPWFLRESEQVYRALVELSRGNVFDIIEFAECGAGGFRAVQAKRSGLNFCDTRLAIRLHSSSQWIRESNRQWMGSVDDLKADFCERYSFDHADIQLSPNNYMFSYARSIGWRVRDDARVITYPFPRPHGAPVDPPQGDFELVFFGRLEARKGLEVFLDVAPTLPDSVGVSFLGRDTVIGPGVSAVDQIRRAMGERPYSIHTGFNRAQAHAYLRSGNRLAVMPSLVDNFPFTVIEAAVEGFPFIASRVGGTAEILPDAELDSCVLFHPDRDGLKDAIDRYARATVDARRAWQQRAREVTDLEENRQRVLDGYTALASTALRGRGPASSGASKITIGIPHFNMPSCLEEALCSVASLARRDRVEVIALDDGSDAPARRAFDQLAESHPWARFIAQEENVGLGAARNRLLEEAEGDYFLPLDADNVADPRLVETLAGAMDHRPEAAALSCYFTAFEEGTKGSPYSFRPTGGPLVLAAAENVYGDATTIFRTEALRSIGGYTTDRGTTFEDWETLVRLALAGHEVDVVPEYLYRYRHHSESLSRITNEVLNQQRVLRHFVGATLSPSEQAALWTAFASLAANDVRTKSVLSQLALRGVARVEHRLRASPKLWRALKTGAAQARQARGWLSRR